MDVLPDLPAILSRLFFKWRCQSFLLPTALHRLDRPAVKEHTAAVSRKGWETDDFEFCVDFWTVVGNLQCLAIERRVFIDSQPFGIHIGKNAAKGVVNQLLQRQLFQFRIWAHPMARGPKVPLFGLATLCGISYRFQ